VFGHKFLLKLSHRRGELLCVSAEGSRAREKFWGEAAPSSEHAAHQNHSTRDIFIDKLHTHGNILW
jgi:hypothetical protein